MHTTMHTTLTVGCKARAVSSCHACKHALFEAWLLLAWCSTATVGGCKHGARRCALVSTTPVLLQIQVCEQYKNCVADMRMQGAYA